MLVREKLESVIRKIEEIRRDRLDLETVGTAADFGRPMDEEGVAEIEVRVGIKLPEDYRRFVTEVGNGGFGPGLGLVPLGEESFVDPRIPQSRMNALNPRGRCEYQLDWNYLPLKQAMENGSPDTDELMEYYFSVARIDGAIRVADLGCGAIALLALNGTERGKIWLDYRGTFGGITPATRSDRDLAHLEFLDWYDAWLTEILLRLPLEERHIV